MTDTFNKLKEILIENLGREDNEIKEDSNIKDDLGADSLDMVELTMACEDYFDIEISDSEVEKIKTVSDAIKLIENKK